MIQRLILGAGVHGRVVADILHSCRMPLNVYLDDDPSLWGREIDGTIIVGGLSDTLLDLDSADTQLHVALGKPILRLDLAKRIQEYGIKLFNAIHSSAVISELTDFGEGVCVCAGAVVNPHAVIGDAVIINTGATIDHDCVVGNGVNISPGVHLAGRVFVGELSFLSTGVIVAPRVTIGANSILGAGSVVVNNIPEGVLAYGVPAKVIQKLDENYDWNKLL